MERLAAEGVDVVRVVYPDLIGTDRARDVLLEHLPSACDHGLAFCRAVYHTTPQGDVVPVAGGLDAGLPDVSVRPDLSTAAPLPWEPGVAACLGEVTDPATGGPAPESPRDLLRTVLSRCSEQGLRPVVGPELEYFLLEPAEDAHGLAPCPGDHRRRLHRRPARRPRQPPAAHPAPAARPRPRRRDRQPRVRRRPVRDQPHPLRGTGRRRPRLPLQGRREGARPQGRQPGHLHGQTVRRQPAAPASTSTCPATTRRAATPSTTRQARTDSRPPPATRSPASSPTPPRSRPWPTPP